MPCSSGRALLLGARLTQFLEPQGCRFSQVLTIVERGLRSLAPFALQSAGLLPELVAAHREIIAVAQRMPLCIGGAAVRDQAERNKQKDSSQQSASSPAAFRKDRPALAGSEHIGPSG
jgi:hypothetical protein